MTLLTIAEVLAGEVLVTPGGVVDRTTARGEETVLWSLVVTANPAAARTAAPATLEELLVAR